MGIREGNDGRRGGGGSLSKEGHLGSVIFEFEQLCPAEDEKGEAAARLREALLPIGSAVVITLATQHYTVLARNLLYTAVTRGKRPVIVVGQRRALAIAVRTSNARRRWTKLAGWLQA